MRRALLIGAVALGALAAAAPAQGFVYWANYGGVGTSGGTSIGRANNDGSGVDNNFIPIAGHTDPCGVAITDTSIYWANSDQDSGSTLGRADIDGSNPDPEFITGAVNPCFPTVGGNRLYWTNFQSDSVGRSDLDGTNVDQNYVASAGDLPCGVAVSDTAIYYADQTGNRIGVANLSGTITNPNLITGANEPCGLAVNGAHVYWANRQANSIGRANLDGSGVDQSFITGASDPCGVAVSDTHIYWANEFNETIGRANLNGTSPNQTFIPSVAAFPCGVAVDDGVRTSGATVTCSPAGAALNQPTTCTANVSDTGTGLGTAPTGTVSFSSASGGASFQGPDSCTLSPAGGSQASCSVVYRPGFGANLVLGFYQGDASHEGTTAIGQVTVGSYALGAVSFNTRAGTATLTATVPGPGVVTQNGDRTVAGSAAASAAGQVSLPIRATGVALRKLKRTGSVTVVAETDYAPAGGGQEGSANLPVRLVKSKKKPKKKKKKRKRRR